jgi:membrane dipeptidase
VGDTAGGRRPTLEEYFRHIDYGVQLVGVDHVGIGTDIFADPTPGTWWNSNPDALPGDLRRDDLRHHGLAGFRHHTGSGGRGGHGQARVRGEDIVKIVGANWMRVFRAAWRN